MVDRMSADLKAHEPYPAGGLRRRAAGTLKHAFLSAGILPLLILLALSALFFGLQEPRFLSIQNVLNIMRQSTYLIIVSMGQMIVLLTAGLDLSLGSTIALVSVVSVLVMVDVLGANPEATWLAITAGMAAGAGIGMLIGVANGVGVALLRVPPFMMTLGMLSIGLGAALTLSSGSPVFGVPDLYSLVFGYGRIFGIPAPVYFTAALFLIVYVVLNWTPMGRYFYALGSNRRAARLSGIRTTRNLVYAYVGSGLLAAIAGLLLTARTASGEATIGQDLVLQSVAACVIGGVSLFGGIGRVGNVLLGGIFISLLTNGMNLIRIESYVQQIVLGIVLILAIVIDQLRLRYGGHARTE
jgi:ribose transport system permease protein